jgi:hypothetical protein
MWSQGATQDYAASLLTYLDHQQFQAHMCRSDQPAACVCVSNSVGSINLDNEAA